MVKFINNNYPRSRTNPFVWFKEHRQRTASNGNLTKEKFITKTAMLAVPEVGGAALKSLGAPAAKTLFNLETMAVDKSLDLMREAKTGPYNEN